MAAKPLWRQLFDAVDRRVAGPVDAGARSNAFADVLAVSWRLGRRVQHELERHSRRTLHLLNLPTATDVRRLSEQLAALQREVRAVQDRDVPEVQGSDVREVGGRKLEEHPR